MRNFYENCIQCIDCNLPFLPENIHEEICPECHKINAEGDRAREEEAGASQGKTD